MEILTVERLGLVLWLSFFFGLAFEGFYWNSALSRPGGIRTFPLLRVQSSASNSTKRKPLTNTSMARRATAERRSIVFRTTTSASCS